MSEEITKERLQIMADFYEIDLKEAYRRHHTLKRHEDNPLDPICMGCALRPHEISDYQVDYQVVAREHEDDDPTDSDINSWVIDNEGTFNPANGHILCDQCYIINGQPSSDRGWVCP